MDVAYLAGILDGEGSIILRMRGINVDFSIQVSMTDREPLDLFKLVFGGGNVRRYEKIPKGGRKAVYRWSLHSKMADAALREMMPFLLVKRSRAELAIRIRALGQFHRWNVNPEIVKQREALCDQFGVRRTVV